MKQMLALLSAGALLCSLSACGSSNAAPSTSSAASTVSSPPDLQESDVLAAYERAAEIYDWFDLASLPADGALLTEDGQPYNSDADSIPYQPVNDQNLSTLADLDVLVRSCFSPEMADEIMGSGVNYRDIDGKLYTAGGARGSNLYLLGKTAAAEQVDENRWQVTLTFYADSYEFDDPRATIGYSQTTLDYENTENGWRFTSFCSSDGLDDTADTVFTFSFEGTEGYLMDGQAPEDCGDLQLACWLLHSDGLSEGASDRMAHRFLDDPDSWFSALSVFVGSPWENAQTVMEEPAYATHAWLTAEEQSQFEGILATYQPKNAAQQSLLDGLKAAWNRAQTLTA